MEVSTGYWSFCSSDECLGVLKGLGNFSSGAADALTLRGLFLGSGQYPSDALVNKNSTTYSVGHGVGASIRDTVAIAALPTLGALANGKYGSWFGRGGGFFNSGKVRFGWYWEGPAVGGRDAIGLRIGAARGTSWWSHIPFLYP